MSARFLGITGAPDRSSESLTETSEELRISCASGKSTAGIVGWCQGQSEGDPEGTKGSEDDEGEGVANDPLASMVSLTPTNPSSR